MTDFQVIPAELAIKAMRDGGFKDTAHAVAELVDNSIQAGANKVSIICVEAYDSQGMRARKRVQEIYVLDNGCGMESAVLRAALQFGNGTRLSRDNQNGMGKFGMGLPNSSISQCERVDVWSWKRAGLTEYSYLDVQEIRQGTLKEVPIPVESTIPKVISSLFEKEIGESGTLVRWSKLDRVRWKTAQALFSNSSSIIGRMYRNFIFSNTAAISLEFCEEDEQGRVRRIKSMHVEPNDPLYLMHGTSLPDLPDPHTGSSFFEEYGEPDNIAVTLPNGEIHDVQIRYSIAKPEIRKLLAEKYSNPGSSPQGKHAAKNIGVSVVRAGRELEMNRTFDIGYNPKERWWGIEVSFSPALDEIFGVTNNKQAATQFMLLDEKTDAESEGLGVSEYRDALREESDPRWFIYELSNRISANLSAMRKQIDRVREGARVRLIDEAPVFDPAEQGATRATTARKEDGHSGSSDLQEDLAPEQRETQIAELMIEQGFDPDEAKEIAVKHVQSNIKYIFSEAGYEGNSFFSVASKGGAIIVTLNRNHPVSEYLYSVLSESEGSKEKALQALKVLLCAWARMEDESRDKAREKLADMRSDWGRMARDFLNATYEE